MAVHEEARKGKDDDDGVLPDEFEVNTGSDSENESEEGGDGEFFADQVADEEDSGEADDITAGFKVVDDEDDEAATTDEEGEDDEEENERFAVEESHSEGEPSGSEDGSDDGEKGDKSKSSAYSRAFSKIFQNKAAKESETGPLLAARQTLVARKLEEEAGETKEKKDTKKVKKELREKAHLYPQSFTDTKEKDLVKLATRGVVKLFNAVSKAQKVQASADGRDAKVVAKESKAAFLAGVKGNGTVGSKRKVTSSAEPPFKFGTSEAKDQSSSRWAVVKDDFMIGKQKLKDWDKVEEVADVAQVNNAIDDDSD